jgi:hypothetical protein
MNYKLKTATLLVFALFLLIAGKVMAGIPRTGFCEELRNADDLWRAGYIHETHDIYTEVAYGQNHSVLDRVGALQRLALQARLKNEEADSALVLLEQAVQLGEAKALSYAMMSRFSLDKGLSDSAIILAKYSLAESKTLLDSVQAVVTYGRLVFESAKEAYLASNVVDTLMLHDAAQELAGIGQQVPSEAYIWDCLLGVTLLLGDGPVVMSVWKQYLGMAADDTLFILTGRSVPGLSQMLSSWNNTDLDYGSRRLLVKALASSRMYGYAKMMVGASELPSAEKLRSEPEISSILSYADLISEARLRINHIYRKRLMGDLTVATDIQEFLGLAYNYWQSLDYPGGRPEFSTDEIGMQLSQRWGAAFCSVDFSPQNFDITWGHAVRTDVRKVEQYRHQIDVKFVDLDQMVSSGMMAWITDGDVQIGGWTPTPEAIYRIRPAWYASGIGAWEALTFPEKQKRIQDQILSLGMVDDSLAKADPYADLPGVALRILYTSQQRLYNSQLSTGHTGKEPRRAFIDGYQRLKYESSIVAHEGRHALDMAFYGDEFETWDAAMVELRGKLSEVVFSPDPWFTVGNSAAVFYVSDTTSGHGAACRLIRKQLVDWMEDHADEIGEFDHSRPTLPQLNLLSTEQLLTALKELDPLAKAGQ